MPGKGLYANIHAKRKRGGKMKKKGVPKKHKGFSKLPEAVQRKINKKLAKKV